MARYNLGDFVADTKALMASTPDPKALLNKGHDMMARLVSDPQNIGATIEQLVEKRNHALYVETPQGDGLAVQVVVWKPGARTDPHDHHTWGMIGVLSNAVEEVRFRRLPEAMPEGFAKLEEDRLVASKPGEVSLLIPGEDEIHIVQNPSDRPTVEIHVYGHDLVGLERCRYNLETGAITTFKTEPSGSPWRWK